MIVKAALPSSAGLLEIKALEPCPGSSGSEPAFLIRFKGDLWTY